MVGGHPTRRSDMRTGTIEELSQELKEKLGWNKNLIITNIKNHIVINDPSISIIPGEDLNNIAEIARKYGYSFYVGWDHYKGSLEVVIH